MKLLLTFTLTLYAFISFGQGTIKGQLKDKSTQEGLINALVKIKDTETGAVSDLDGNFEISKVKSGKYVIEISCLGYKTINLTDITVESDKTTLINTSLETDQAELAEVVVTATRTTNTEVALISQIKEAKQIVSGVSAEQIIKSQDKDAAEVVRRIPGVTVVDNRFINVRGLNERYNSVWLNDAVAPSFETDKKSFSFDIIPSNLLDRVMIFKTFTPDLPGDFAGGLVKVYTRKPSYGEKSFNLSYSVGYRDGTTNKNFVTDKTYDNDLLGLGYIDRALPNLKPDANGVIPSLSARQIANTYPLNNRIASPDQRLNASYLTGFRIGEQEFSSLTAVSYSKTATTYDINRLDVFRENVMNRDQQYTDNVKVGLMQNFTYNLKSGDKIEFRNMLNQLGKSQTTLRNSFDEQGQNQTKYSYAMGYQSRFTYNGQIAGNHTFGADNDIQLDWVLGYANSNKQEPDYRRTQYNFNSKEAILPQGGVDLFSGSRLYQHLNENIYSANLNILKKFNENFEIKFGGYYEDKSRTFMARQFGYSLSFLNNNYNRLINLPINQIFNNNNVENTYGLSLQEDGNSISTKSGVKPNYSYDAANKLAAGYLAANIEFGKLKIVTGARLEHNEQSIVAGLNGTPINQDVITNKLLPSLTLSYNFNSKSLVRLAYGRTLNRPEFREWAPFVYYDFDVNSLNYGSLYLPSAGNGTVGTVLKTSDIDNIDLRYEYYPAEGENIHAGLFYKHFTNPIEATIANNPSNLAFTFTNAPSAKAYGIEIDVRKKLNFFGSRFLDNISVLFNTSLIKSEVDVDATQSWTPKRKLQGQSPYVVNLGAYYQYRDWQLSALYNVFGPRIVYIGSGNPPISEVVEMPRHTIDLTVTKNLSRTLSLTFGISDLLNQRVLLLQDSPDAKDNKFNAALDPHFADYRRGSYYNAGLKLKL